MTAVGDNIAVLLGGGTIEGTITARNNDGTVAIRVPRGLIANESAGQDFTAEAILVYRIVEAPCVISSIALEAGLSNNISTAEVLPTPLVREL